MSGESNASEVAGDIAALATKMQKRVHTVVTKWTNELERRVASNASGRPGPNVITGNYRRSINHQITSSESEVTGTVGTNAPQARRLEHGFHGTDSLGRSYSQPAYPHFGPALDSVKSEFEADVAAIAGGTD